MDHLDPPDFEDLRSEPAFPAVDAAISDVAAADVVFTEVAVAAGAVAETAPTLAPEAVAANGAPADVDSAAPPISWIPATVVVPEIVPDFLASEPAPADVVSEAESVGVFVAEPAPADVLLSERAPADALPAELAAPDIVVSADGASPDSIAAATEDAAAAVAPAPKVDPKAAELRRRAQESWERVVAAKESGEVLTGFVISAVKGGLLVDISGIRGFLPASQARAPEGGALDALVKTKVPLKILDLDTSRRRAVVSQRRALEEDRRTKRAELIRSLAAGQRREGVVVRLVDFGAFVDLGGIDGLIPMSELAFERIEKAADVVAVGERVTVDVLRVDEGGKKISLSRKSALPDPWRDHAD